MNNDEDDLNHADKPQPIDPQLIEALAEIATRQGLSEIEVRQKGLRIRVARQLQQQTVQISAPQSVAAAPSAAPQPTPAASPAPAADHPGAVRSPMVGTVFLRPEPGADPFVQVGDTVQQGDRVMLVEAMKTFNDIVAPRDGTITSILINDGEPVEFGEPLIIIE